MENLWAWTDHPGDLGQVLSVDQVLDNITLYCRGGHFAAWEQPEMFISEARAVARIHCEDRIAGSTGPTRRDTP